MGSHLVVFIEKIYLGLLLAAPLGPVSLEMIKRGLTSGFWSSFSIRLGAVAGNTLCLALTCVGLSKLSELSLLLNVLGFMGVFLLFYLGYTTLTQSMSLEEGASGPRKSVRSGLLWGFYLAIFNPVALAFWPGIFAASLGENPSIGLKDFFENTFILVGILLWGMSLSYFSSFGRKFLSLEKLGLIAKFSGVLILAYGTKNLYNMLERVHFF